MIIEDNKYVELTYSVIDQKTGATLVNIEYPLGYVQGGNEILSPMVMDQLDGKCEGDIINVPIDCTLLYGERDENLVFTDAIENVPEDYREVGTTIVMENSKGEPKEFIVTRMDDKTLTVDGNNPLCGREVVFKIEILKVREATEQELEDGGPAEPDLNDIMDAANAPGQT